MHLNRFHLPFDQAIGADPNFALAYLYRARTASSAADWKTNSDKALEHKDSASEAEQLLIDMIPTFMADDRSARLGLARKLADTYPNTPRALIELAQAQQSVDDVESAVMPTRFSGTTRRHRSVHRIRGVAAVYG